MDRNGKTTVAELAAMMKMTREVQLLQIARIRQFIETINQRGARS